jgi:hypothetical protein
MHRNVYLKGLGRRLSHQKLLDPKAQVRQCCLVLRQPCPVLQEQHRRNSLFSCPYTNTHALMVHHLKRSGQLILLRDSLWCNTAAPYRDKQQ